MHFIFKMAVGTSEGSKDTTHRAVNCDSIWWLEGALSMGRGGFVTYRKPDHES